MNQLYVYLYPFPLGPSCHPPSHPTAEARKLKPERAPDWPRVTLSVGLTDIRIQDLFFHYTIRGWLSHWNSAKMPFPSLTPLVCKQQNRGEPWGEWQPYHRLLTPAPPPSSPGKVHQTEMTQVHPCLAPFPSLTLSTWTGNQRAWCPNQGPRDLETIPGDICHICGG